MNTITKEELQEKIRLHGEWLKDNSKGERLILINYDLSDSDLMGSNLSYSNLRGSNLDFSSGIPLSCGGLNFTCDKRLATQLLYHLLSLNVVDFPEWEKVRNNKTLLKIANMTHLIDVHDLPNLEKKEDQ